MLSNCSMIFIYYLQELLINSLLQDFQEVFPILMTLLLLSGCATQSAEKNYRQITMEEAVTMMEEETGYIILDVRTAQEYSEKHIPGAINIANESIGTEDISELPDKDRRN